MSEQHPEIHHAVHVAMAECAPWCAPVDPADGANWPFVINPPEATP